MNMKKTKKSTDAALLAAPELDEELESDQDNPDSESDSKSKSGKGKKASDTADDLADTLKMLQTKFGDGAIMKLGEAPKVSVGAISTGSLGLDAAMGIGGLPMGTYHRNIRTRIVR
jgi:hypothetical protein